MQASGERVAIAWTLLLRARGRLVMVALAEAGIPAILLKGPVTAAWLYPDGRTYRDIDVLVAPSRFDEGMALLEDLGYRNPLRALKPNTISPNETHLFSDIGVCVDLHRRLIGIPDTRADVAFTTFYSEREPFDLDGRQVWRLDETARLMHAALHLAAGGPADTRALEDLRRALAAVGSEAWRRSADLAERLDATEAFAAGLRVDEAGERLADQLGLPRVSSTEQILRATSASAESLAIARFVNAHGLSARAELLRHHVFPHRDVLFAAATPGASLPRLRAAKALDVLRKLPAAARSYLRAMPPSLRDQGGWRGVTATAMLGRPRPPVSVTSDSQGETADSPPGRQS